MDKIPDLFIIDHRGRTDRQIDFLHELYPESMFSVTSVLNRMYSTGKARQATCLILTDIVVYNETCRTHMKEARMVEQVANLILESSLKKDEAG